MKTKSPGTRPAILLCSALVAAAPCLPQTGVPKPRILVFHGCGGNVHASIPYINQVWFKLAAENGFDLDTSGEATVFTSENLSRYAAVLWNNSTHPGKLLDSAKRSAWLAYAKTGGYVGMHAAGDVSDTWPDYVKYMGGTNSQHSNTTLATLNIESGTEASRHPIVLMAGWPASLQITDEWYSWRVNPRTVPGIRILYTLDEKSFTPGVAMGDDHPIAWTRESPEGGRMFYMGMGHNIELFKPVPDKGYAIMEKMMRSALLWATKREPVSLTPFQAEINPTGKPYSRDFRGDRILFRASLSADGPYLDAAGRWSGRPPILRFRETLPSPSR
jgi:uncharacterized protein